MKEEVKQLNHENIDEITSLRIDLQNYDKKYFKEDDIIINQEQLKKNTEVFLKKNLNKNLFLFGYYTNNTLVSICGLYLERHFPTYINANGKIAYICNVYTKPEYRKKGYQRNVFEYCLAYAKENKIKQFQLDSKNEIAIKFYKEYGFKEVDNAYYLSI